MDPARLGCSHKTMINKRNIWLFYTIAAVIVLLDQLSKHWVMASFELYQRMPIMPLLDFTFVYNEGAAWSFLSDAGGWQRYLLTAISAVMSVALIVWIKRSDPTWLQRLSLAFILGGAVGNLYDRAVWGKVVDFILVYYQDWSYPVFNLADSAITVGAIMLFIDMFVNRESIN